MTRLRVVVEEQSEEAFVKNMLGPHLNALEVWTTATIVTTNRSPSGQKQKGGGVWSKWCKDIRLHCLDRGSDLRITTMFDRKRPTALVPLGAM